MIEKKLKLQVITPNGVLYDDFIKSVSFYDTKGKIVLSKDYASTIGFLNIGLIIINDGNQDIEKLVGNGTYVISENILKILTIYFLDNNEKSIQYIENQKEQAIKILNEKSNNKINFSENLNIAKMIQNLKRK